MSLCDLAPHYVRGIAPYQPGKPIAELAREMNIDEDEIVKLASNENPLGTSPRVLAAIENAFLDLSRYPDGAGFELKEVLAERFNLAPEQFVLGNGSNDVLELAARAFLTAGASAVYSQYAFAVYPLAVQGVGARGIEVPAADYGHDLTAMLEAIEDDTRMVFIANPNNPTGTFLPSAAVKRFLEEVPREVLVVLDEAYYEYLAADLRGDSAAWIAHHPNLIVTRTFSKAYGLAGLRVGYAMTSAEVADMLNRVRQPFNVNSLAQAAAMEALVDEAFLEHCLDINEAGMDQLTEGFKRLGVDYIPSHGNFVCCRVGNATAMYRRLLQQGVIVRPVANYGLPEHLRVSVGLESENKKFLRALEHALNEF